MPLLYALMSGKSSDEYAELFFQIKKLTKRLKEVNLVVDFEAGINCGFNMVFFNDKIFFCLFHFGQAIIRRLQNYGLMQYYNDNLKHRIYLKMFCSLAFVPVESVIIEFQRLIKNIPEGLPDQIKEFISFFEINYLKNLEFISRWNAVYRIKNNIPLTTNSAESFNSNLNKFINRNHPNMACFISNLQLIQNENEDQVNYIISHPYSDTKKMKQKQKEESIKEIVKNYNNYYGMNYLKAIALTYGWKCE